jgi:hypothetical protein
MGGKKQMFMASAVDKSRMLKPSSVGGRYIPGFVVLLCLTLVHAERVNSAERDRHAPDEAKTTFLQEGPRKWEDYQQLCRRLQGTVVGLSKLNGKTVSELTWDVKQNGHCRLLVERGADESVPVTLSAYNPDYAFQLERRADTPWLLTKIGRRQEDQDALALNTDRRLCLTSYLLRMYAIELPDLVKRASFSIREATPVMEAGEQLVRIEFENGHPRTERPFCAIQRGSMTLDPANYWCLRKCNAVVEYNEGSGALTIETEMIAGPRGYPVPKKWVAKHVLVRKEDLAQTIRFDQKMFELSEPPELPSDGEFALAAFGLPEPNAGLRNSRRYAWFASAGVTALALSLFLLYLRHRHRGPLREA